jgi:hypothetical protein
MIIVKLTGGLGNQLFQYVWGKSIAQKNNEELLLDISWYKGRLSRKYILYNFNIKSDKANYITTQFIKIFNKNKYLESDRTNEWQSTIFLKDIGDNILKEFTLKNPPKNSINTEESVSIHLRGGDYVTGNKSNFHGLCPPEYYNKAIEYIKNKTKSPHFYIFTDDLTWAQKHINFPAPFTLISNQNFTPHEEMILMSSCKHNIIANSTFSWWSAWLNSNHDKIVISPKKWFSDESNQKENLIPETWIQI